MPSPVITLATHRTLSKGAPDDRLLAEALARRGIAARFGVWNDPYVDWAATPVTLVRSTWDYYQIPEHWTAWIERVRIGTCLVNSPSLLHWSSNKRYLTELERHGVPCVATVVVESTESESLKTIARRQAWGDVVVKPAVAASAYGARRFGPETIDTAGEVHLAALLKRGPAIVQPYIRAVETERERSLVFIAGEFTHSFTKPAFSVTADGATDIHLVDASKREHVVALSALAVLPEKPLYARVDLVPTEAGPLLMELELVEPDLGLRLSAHGLQTLASACESIVGLHRVMAHLQPDF